MARRQFANRSSRRPNRSWGGLVDVNNNLTAASTKTLIGSFVLNNSNIDETVLRTVGSIAVTSDQIVATENQQGALGLIVVSDEAVVAGAASIPGPLTNIADDGWFVHIPIFNKLVFSDATGYNFGTQTVVSFDFKSKRIIHEGQRIAMMFETTSNSAGLILDVIMRTLTMVTGTGK